MSGANFNDTTQQPTTAAPVVTAATAYTPSINWQGSLTNTARWCMIGSNLMHIEWDMIITGPITLVPGALTNELFTSLPPGWQIDFSYYPQAFSPATPVCGHWSGNFLSGNVSDLYGPHLVANEFPTSVGTDWVSLQALAGQTSGYIPSLNSLTPTSPYILDNRTEIWGSFEVFVKPL